MDGTVVDTIVAVVDMIVANGIVVADTADTDVAEDEKRNNLVVETSYVIMLNFDR